MNYANLIYTFPKIVDMLFRKLWMIRSEDCGFLLSELSIIKILLRYLVGILSVYRPVSESYVSRGRQVSGKNVLFLRFSLSPAST